MSQRVNTQSVNIRKLNKRTTKQGGMTFIEVLIALVIMVTGILGAVAMQATAKKGSFDAMQRSLASSLGQDIVERMRSNDATTLISYKGANYGEALGAPVPACNAIAGCSSANMITNDIYEWEMALMGANVKNGTNNVGGLVEARACIDVVNNSEVTVVITWEGRTKTKSDLYSADCSSLKGERRQVLVEAFIY